MSFQWNEYLDLSRELIGKPGMQSSEEAKSRAAVSRAYYAAFCTARNLLRDKYRVIATNPEQAHKTVRQEFESSEDRLRQRIGNWLRDMLRHRNRADYDDIMDDAKMQSEVAIMRADQVLKNIKQLQK